MSVFGSVLEPASKAGWKAAHDEDDFQAPLSLCSYGSISLLPPGTLVSPRFVWMCFWCCCSAPLVLHGRKAFFFILN